MEKIGLPEWVLKLAYKLIDVEKLSPTVDERVLEYSFTISKLCALQPGNLLDIGCVARVNLVPATFCELGWKVWGIDLRTYSYQHPSFNFIQDDILSNNLPFPERFFDAVTAVSTIEHLGVKGRYGVREKIIWADKSIFNKVKRLLKPGGRFLVTVPYGPSYQETTLGKVYDRDNLTWLSTSFKIRELRIVKSLALMELEK